MTAVHSNLPITYQRALRDYLACPDDKNLQQAFELGGAAMNAGLGIFDLIRLHHQALADGVSAGASAAESVRPAPELEFFLLEALSPFEAAFRGFRSAREKLQELNGVLAERNEALALSNAQLEEEIAVRQRVEAALRESKDHYYRLFQQAHAMEEDLRQLSAKVLSAQEEERTRISRELHDEIGQALTAVTVAMAMLKKPAGSDSAFQRKVAEAERLLAQSMETVHSFARELRPAVLDHLGIQAALRAHVANFARRTGIRTELIAHPALARIDGPRGEVIFRVVQEGLNNIFKHARATAAKIEFSVAAGTLGMEIEDNGRAFCAEEKLGGKPTSRLGLLGMQERIRRVDGTFAIKSVPKCGTRIQVQIPFGAPPEAAVPPQSNCDAKNICAAR